MYVCLVNPVPASPDPFGIVFVVATRPRATLTPLARPPDLIDKATKEIRQDEDQIIYKSLDAIADDLPDHTPRFILLSYPLTLVRLAPLSCSGHLSGRTALRREHHAATRRPRRRQASV